MCDLLGSQGVYLQLIGFYLLSCSYNLDSSQAEREAVKDQNRCVMSIFSGLHVYKRNFPLTVLHGFRSLYYCFLYYYIIVLYYGVFINVVSWLPRAKLDNAG
jgi:hypothetical protein